MHVLGAALRDLRSALTEAITDAMDARIDDLIASAMGKVIAAPVQALPQNNADAALALVLELAAPLGLPAIGNVMRRSQVFGSS